MAAVSSNRPPPYLVYPIDIHSTWQSEWQKAPSIAPSVDIPEHTRPAGSLCVSSTTNGWWLVVWSITRGTLKQLAKHPKWPMSVVAPSHQPQQTVWPWFWCAGQKVYFQLIYIRKELEGNEICWMEWAQTTIKLQVRINLFFKHNYCDNCEGECCWIFLAPETRGHENWSMIFKAYNPKVLWGCVRYWT